jgi:hypothetical protein
MIKHGGNKNKIYRMEFTDLMAYGRKGALELWENGQLNTWIQLKKEGNSTRFLISQE